MSEIKGSWRLYEAWDNPDAERVLFDAMCERLFRERMTAEEELMNWAIATAEGPCCVPMPSNVVRDGRRSGDVRLVEQKHIDWFQSLTEAQA